MGDIPVWSDEELDSRTDSRPRHSAFGAPVTKHTLKRALDALRRLEARQKKQQEDTDGHE